MTIGLDPSVLSPTDVLAVSIDEGGDGGDGWAVDFLTVGVTTNPVPETFSTIAILLLASAGVMVCATWRREAIVRAKAHETQDTKGGEEFQTLIDAYKR